MRLLTCCLIALLHPLTGSARPITDTTSDGWRPPRHAIAEGVYVSAQHLVVVRARWLHVWSASRRMGVGYAFGSMVGDDFVRSAAMARNAPSLPLADDRRTTRLVATDGGLCAGPSCAIRLAFHPADFSPVDTPQTWRARGWTATVRAADLSLSMRAGPRTVTLAVSDRASAVVTLSPSLSRDPPKHTADGRLSRRGGVYHGHIQGPPAAAPTAMVHRFGRSHVAWRRPGGGVTIWFPNPDPYAPKTNPATPWLLELDTPGPVAPPGVTPALDRGWPRAEPDTVGCRCVRPPCSPLDAPRVRAARELQRSGLPLWTAGWTCDRPHAVRRWSLAPFGWRGDLRYVRPPSSTAARTQVQLEGAPVVVGGARHIRLDGLLPFDGRAQLNLIAHPDGRLTAQLDVMRELPAVRATPRLPDRLISLGVREQLGGLWHLPDGAFRLGETLGGAAFERRYTGLLEAPLPDGRAFIQVLASGALAVSVRRTRVLTPTP